MFKKIAVVLTVIAAAAALASQVHAANKTDPDTGSSDNTENYKTITIDGKRYALTFEDDFDGTELDTKKWKRCSQEKRQDLNNYWDDSMSYLDGKGNLIIGMSYNKERDAFLSGAVETRGKFEQTFGYYEIKCAVNNVPGYWTAFWLMSDGVMSEANGGVDGTEIDIYESPFFSKNQIQHTLHWDGYESAHKSDGKVVNANVYDGKYHTFSFLWTEEEYVYYIDGKETWRTTAAEAKGTCKVPSYMIISSEMGGWTGSPPVNSLPDYMKVDYVRVYSYTEEPVMQTVSSCANEYFDIRSRMK